MATQASLVLQVELDRVAFAKLRSEASRKRNSPAGIAAIAEAAKFAVRSSTGVFRAPELDKMLLEISDTLPNLPDKNRSGVLHVMSQAYLSGGHTRVVERWIEYDAESGRHSVIITEQGMRRIPPRLTKAVSATGGDIVLLNEREQPLERAAKLRAYASGYDHVVLCAHMHDIVPSLALGSTQLPLIFYNHADHRFSIGMDAASAIAETRSWGQHLSANRRGVSGTRVLGIPSNNHFVEPISAQTRAIARQSIGLPDKAVVAITAGTSHKYAPMLQYNFFDLLKTALEKNTNLHFILVGAPEEQVSLLRKYSRVASQVHAYSSTDEAGFQKYISASDFAIDTLPENGCTTLMDMIEAGIPVISRLSPVGQMDYLVGLKEYCHSDQELLEQVGHFVSSAAYRAERHSEQLERLRLDAAGNVFQHRLEMLYAEARATFTRPARIVGPRNETASELDYLLALPRANSYSGRVD